MNKERDIEFLFIFGFGAFLCVVLVSRLAWQSNKLFVGTDQHGLTFVKGDKHYPWSSLQKIEPLKVRLQVMAAPYPGYTLHFDNGDKRLIDQRLKGYTELYQELYQHKIPGAEKPLYLYETGITGGKKTMRRQYHSVYYPDKDEVVKETGIAKYD